MCIHIILIQEEKKKKKKMYSKNLLLVLLPSSLAPQLASEATSITGFWCVIWRYSMQIETNEQTISYLFLFFFSWQLISTNLDLDFYIRALWTPSFFFNGMPLKAYIWIFFNQSLWMGSFMLFLFIKHFKKWSKI